MSSPSPAMPPANSVLFERALRTGGNPSAILDSILRLCQLAGRDLSKESRITKIKYCKSAKSPYHEYLLIYATYVSEGKSYPQYKCVALVERNANRRRRVTPDSAIASSVIAAVSTTSVVSAPADEPPLHLRTESLRSSISLASSLRASSSSFDKPADDFIAVYPDGKVDKGWPKSKATMRFKEGACLSFEQLACIVEVVHELAPKYRLISTQCYWFSICVWATICRILGDGVEYDKDEIRKMGTWAGLHVELKFNEKDGQGRFLLQGEDAGSAVAAYEQRWASWQKKFTDASRVMAAKNDELAAKTNELAAKTDELVAQNDLIARLQADLAAANSQKPSN